MARITTGYTFGLTVKETLACRLLAEGSTEEEAIALAFGVDKNSPLGERQKASRKLHKLMADEKFQECFRAIVRERVMPAYGSAVNRIIQQVNDKSGWLANKAANDVLTRFGPAIMGDDDKSVVIRVEGGPVIGVPDDND